MTKRVICSKYNKEVLLTLDIKDITTLSDSYKKYQITSLSKCSNCKLNICQDCPHIILVGNCIF